MNPGSFSTAGEDFMRARSASGAATKLRIIQVASDLFHKQGIRATSPDQIIEASSTGKGQFYYYFQSKEGLIHEVLQAHMEAIRTCTGFANTLIKSWEDLERFYRSFVDLQKKYNMSRGCPIGQVGNELTEDDDLIRHDVSLIFEIMKSRLAAFFIQEKAKGRLSSDADEGRMADFSLAILEGALLLGKVKRDSRPVEATIKEALIHLKRYVVIPKE
jgi:TetR/AcrR family transcriptional repressor of nem operon